MFELIKSVALRLDQIGLWMRTDVGFATKPPDDVNDFPQPTLGNGLVREPDGFGVTVIKKLIAK